MLHKITLYVLPSLKGYQFVASEENADAEFFVMFVPRIPVPGEELRFDEESNGRKKTFLYKVLETSITCYSSPKDKDERISSDDAFVTAALTRIIE